MQGCHHADQREEAAAENGHEHGVAILGEFREFGIQCRLGEMFEAPHVLANLQHQRSPFALLDVEPRLVGMLRLHGIDQGFLFIDELPDELLDGGDQRALIVIGGDLRFQRPADVQHMVLSGSIGKQVMLLAREHETAKPCFEVHDEPKVLRGQSLGVVNVIELTFVVGERRDGAVGQDAEKQHGECRDHRRKKELAGNGQIAEQVTQGRSSSPTTS